jgi:protein gp37
MGQPNYARGFELTLQPHMLDVPLHWRPPRTVFVHSMEEPAARSRPLQLGAGR